MTERMSTKSFIQIMLLAVFLIAASVLALKLYQGSTEQTTVTRCKSSVDVGDNIKIQWKLDGAQYAELIDCPTRFEEREEKEEDEAKRMLAERMRSCWYKLGEGRKSIFKHEDGVFCVVCDVFRAGV